MAEKFSPQVRNVISYSREEALRLNHNYIGIEHLLLGLIREGEGLAIKVLHSLDVDPVVIRRAVERAVADNSSPLKSPDEKLTINKQAEKVLKITVLEAKQLRNEWVSTEHLFLAILKNPDNVATQILEKHDVNYEIFKAELDYLQNEIKGEPSRDDDGDAAEEDPGSGRKEGGPGF